MDKLAAMRAFVEIIDQGSLTAAARALDRAPPTMVRTLATLEETLGARLLTRTTRRMALTEEGRAYLDRCRRILADVEEAERAVQAGDRTPRGEIRLTAPVLFGQRHVVPAVTEFLRRFQEVRIELLLLDRVVHLVEEGLDLGVRIGHLEDSSMIAVTVGQMRRVVVASPDFLAQVGTPTHPQQLTPYPCVMFRGIAAGGSFSFQDSGRQLTVRVTSPFACNQATAAVEACEAGLGFGQFLSYQVEPQIRAGTLQVVLEDFELPALPVSLVYPDARLMSSRLRTFLDWMKERLRARPEIH